MATIGSVNLKPLACPGDDRFGEEHLLRQESIQQRHARHRGRGHGGHRGGNRHQAAQSAQSPDIARAGFVIDDSRRHEQGRLEGGVIHHVEHRRHERKLAVHAEEQRDQAQVADGRVRQYTFQVALKGRGESADQQALRRLRSRSPRTTGPSRRSAGHRRASRNTPAFTIVAECR